MNNAISTQTQPESPTVVNGIVVGPPKHGDLIWFDCGLYSHIGALSNREGQDGLPKIFHFSKKERAFMEDDFQTAATNLQIGVVPLSDEWRSASSEKMGALLVTLKNLYQGKLVIPIPKWRVALVCEHGVVREFAIERTRLSEAERDIAVLKAREAVGNSGGYSVTSNNCEHIVREIFTGKRESKQLQGAVRGGVFGGVASIAARLLLRANPYTAAISTVFTVGGMIGGVAKSKSDNTEKLPLSPKKE